MDRTATIELIPVRAAGAAMLAVAAVLPVVPVSVGPPCLLRSITGLPCPFCGMTRSVTAAVHGDFARSLALTPAGLLAVLTAIVMIAAWRWRRITVPMWLVSVALALMWGYQLFKYTTGRPL